jgi:hypothetical protein
MLQEGFEFTIRVIVAAEDSIAVVSWLTKEKRVGENGRVLRNVCSEVGSVHTAFFFFSV